MEVKLLTQQILKWSDDDSLRTRHGFSAQPRSSNTLLNKQNMADILKFTNLVMDQNYCKRLPALPTKKIPTGGQTTAIEINWSTESATQKLSAQQVEPVEKKPKRDSRYAKVIPVAPHKPKDTVIYTPKEILKDGFPQSPKPSHPFVPNEHNSVKRNYLLFPPPESTSILFHCRQGELFRKREALVDDPVPEKPLEVQVSFVTQTDRMDSVADLAFYTQQERIELPPSSWVLRWLSPTPSHWVVQSINVAR